MKKSSLITVMLASLMGLVACNKTPAEPPKKEYTYESAIAAVCDQFNTAFELTGDDAVTYDKESDESYYMVMNFGDALEIDQLKTLVDTYLIVEDFTPKYEDWMVDEDEGIEFNFKDYTWNKVLIEYLVYERTGSENSGYDGNYLLVSTGRTFLDWLDADDFEHYLGVQNGSLPTVTLPEGADYRFRFFEENKLGEGSPKQLVGLFYCDVEDEFKAAFEAAGWAFRTIDPLSGLAGYFNSDATLFALLSYEPADDQYEEMTIVQLYNVNDVIE